MICQNPDCRKNHENVRGKCPHCGADFNGHVSGKHAIQPRELSLVTSRRCSHGILLHWPCSKCERSDEDCKTYERSIRFHIKELLILNGVNMSEAWERSKNLLAAVDLIEAQKTIKA